MNLDFRLLPLLAKLQGCKDDTNGVFFSPTVIAVRYPDLVHIDDGVVSYGMHFSANVQQAGGFLPVIWDVPGTDMEAADAVTVVTDYLREHFRFGPDAADSLTVLHKIGPIWYVSSAILSQSRTRSGKHALDVSPVAQVAQLFSQL